VAKERGLSVGVDLLKAMRDLMDEAGLSVFRVDGDEEAERVSVLWAPTSWDRPQGISYLLLTDDCFRQHGLTPLPKPDDEIHSFLSERHYEVCGVDERKARAIAETIVEASQGTPPVKSMTEDVLCRRAKDLAQVDPGFRRRIKENWLDAMGIVNS